MGAAIVLPEGDSIEKDYIVFGWLGGALLLVVWATCRLLRRPPAEDRPSTEDSSIGTGEEDVQTFESEMSSMEDSLEDSAVVAPRIRAVTYS
jgi:hypothetical protein